MAHACVACCPTLKHAACGTCPQSTIAARHCIGIAFPLAIADQIAGGRMVARVLSIGIVWVMASAVEAAPSSFDHSADERVAIGNCAICHQFSDTRSHVTGVRPTFELPAAYPLNEKGELTCSTCHDVMTPSANGSPLVRGGLQGATFCRSCHAAGADDGSRLGHA